MSDEIRSSSDLVPDLRECADEVVEQTARARAEVSILTESQFSWRPEPDRWSVGENLTHLALTTRIYLDAVDDAVEEARADRHVGDPPYRHPWLGRWFIRVLEPPVKMKVKAFSRLEPVESGPKDEVLEDFEESQQEILRSVEEANGVDLGRARFRSPFLGVLKLSVGQAYRIVLAHNRRHFHQIGQILEKEDFPSV